VLGMEPPMFEKFHTKSEGWRTGKPQKRDFLVVVSESTQNECHEDYHMMYILDITDERKPYGVSSFSVPEQSGNFCSRGGRFGTHSSNEDMGPIYYKRMVFIAWFNAGVRAIDIRDPYAPREAGYYIPAINKNTATRCVKVDGVDRCKIAIQTNNVEVDDRGYIYIVDRANTGMHILELTGDARRVANLK
jgi:hypothetical protein